MGMVEIIADFIQYVGNINNPRATIMILKYISRETDIILVWYVCIPCSNQKGWATTTSNVVRKAPKITQLEHKKKITQGTSALIYRQGRSVAKKHGRSSPVGFPPRPPVVAGGAHSGNFLVFVGGWFKFKLGYLSAMV
jgi:hypothetical protein